MHEDRSDEQSGDSVTTANRLDDDNTENKRLKTDEAMSHTGQLSA